MELNLTSIRNTQITLSVCQAGDDLSITLYGGEKGHIGAVTLGFAYQEKIQFQTLVVPEHKEAFLTEQLIQYIVPKYAKTCVISCGIHWDNISNEEITQAVNDSIQLLEEYLTSTVVD
ncbi:hypothetical protein VIN01S_30810 [Vibrio inusitatus NBRC 102082]|uniref:Prenylated flavin chaperone LpdD-like domain-containing protein n=1 Tax=Vibrio inusitatus NBRC 102082 TaxID=1219070 RepID=A0A4Y3HYT8_9VIBR|nr:hypothetical protein [Vibrio inusitatus]GEA52277.1 hypothetical protein VIN01S_30810 [Vibrio inusitatus NBRC 102082]